MKKEQVPQDRIDYYGDARRAVYALESDGHYSTVPSSGWEVEAIVNADAVAEYARQAEEARSRALRGEASPLEFHMYDRRMDLPTLAQTAGIWRWRLRRHLRPAVFGRLSERTLLRYADALGLSLQELKALP